MGTLEAYESHDDNARMSVTAKYLHRVRQVLKSQLNGSKTQAINMYTLPVIRHPAGIVSWLQEEIHTTGVKTQKLLTIHEGFHPTSSILRLYKQRKEDG